ncbi:hypothetical protein ACIPPM_17075 [Streptomyces sp. NPDC090119]|uniref:hypothetical protein n=1 Tax=Streptomyces sp. NPDC090119 TaxID=3365951 RepID=UPI00381552A7
MSIRKAACAALVLAATATACSSGAEPKTIRVTVTQTVTASPGSGSGADGSTPPSNVHALKGEWAFGSTADADEVFEASVAVLGYKQGFTSVGKASEESGEPGYEWAYADIKTCAAEGSYLESTTSWTLYYADGSRVEPSSSTWADFPKPEYPAEVTLTAGKCARGKLAFPVPGDKRPESVIYAPSGLDEPQEWTLAKS